MNTTYDSGYVAAQDNMPRTKCQEITDKGNIEWLKGYIDGREAIFKSERKTPTVKLPWSIGRNFNDPYCINVSIGESRLSMTPAEINEFILALKTLMPSIQVQQPIQQSDFISYSDPLYKKP